MTVAGEQAGAGGATAGAVVGSLGGGAGALDADVELLVFELPVATLPFELEAEPELLGLLVPEPDVAEVWELVPLPPVEVVLEKDCAEPPQPTMEVTAIAGTPNFIRTLGPNCILNLEPIFPTN